MSTTSHKLKGLLIIVNFNQAQELRALLPRVAEVFPLQDIVFVDDGSTDESVAIAREHRFPVVEHGKNLGIGAAIRTGILHGIRHGYDYVCIFSANGKMLPSQISRVTAPLLAGDAEYVTGSRFLRDGSSPGLPLFRRIAIPLYSLCSTLFLKRHFSDITCGFRAYLLSLFQSPEMNLEQDWLNRYEMEYYIHYWCCRKPIRIVEVPVTISYDHLATGRETKIAPITGWWRIVRTFLLLSSGIKK